MTNQEKISKILEEFDFEKVERVMKFLNWKWAGDDFVGIYQPDISDLKEHAEELLREAFLLETTISCGGFKASKSEEDYYLSFVIEDIDKEYVEPEYPF